MSEQSTTITIPVRFSYLHAFKAVKVSDEGEPKFGVSAIISKKDKKTIKLIEDAIELAKAQGKSKLWGGKLPSGSGFKVSFRDGDEDRSEDEGYEGSMFVSCHSASRPSVLDKNMQPIINEDEIGSGDYGFVNITFYPYNVKNNKGIAAGLNHIMKAKDGERFSSKISKEAAFEGIDMSAFDGVADVDTSGGVDSSSEEKVDDLMG